MIVALGILILAVAGSIGQDAKKRSVVGRAWQDWEARTSFVPFAGLLSGRIKWRNAAPGWIALGGGAAFWVAAIWMHQPSVSPLDFIQGS
jgi:uncharacterized membrane protein